MWNIYSHTFAWVIEQSVHLVLETSSCYARVIDLWGTTDMMNYLLVLLCRGCTETILKLDSMMLFVSLEFFWSERDSFVIDSSVGNSLNGWFCFMPLFSVLSFFFLLLLCLKNELFEVVQEVGRLFHLFHHVQMKNCFILYQSWEFK